MRFVWRGLAIGALIGAAIGMIMDLAKRGGELASEGYDAARSAAK